MIKIGVLLSGCGVQDGSEIYEAVLTLLALDKAGVQIHAIAPDVEQAQTINHYTGDEERINEPRHVLAEAARIVRGKISSVTEVSAHDIDGLIIPGGYGAAKNLCSYAVHGLDARVDPGVERLIQDLNGLGKPIGAVCIAPVVVALALRESETRAPLQLTVGNDAHVALDLTKLGVEHRETSVDQIYTDKVNHIVTTAAFMLAEGPAQAEPGITKLVHQVLALVQENRPGYSGEPAVSGTLPAN